MDDARITSVAKRWRRSPQTRFVPDQGRNRIGSMIAAQAGLVHQPPTRLGRANCRLCRKIARGNRCVTAQVVARIVEAFKQDGAAAWYALPAIAFSWDRLQPGRL